jgi:uncharacterized protein
MVVQKGSRKLGILLTMLLLFIQVLFQFMRLNIILIVLILLLISVAFFEEKYRVFIWCIISFTMGLFALVYIDRVLVEFSLARPELFILNRMLLLIPISIMSYILLKFKEVKVMYIQMPNLESTFKIPFLSQVSIKSFIWIVFIIHLVALLYALIAAFPVSSSNLFYAITFSVISGILIELLWRGILLSRIESILGEKPAVFFTSISCSLALLLFGFSLFYSLFFFVMGLILGFVTYKTKSIYPAITLSILLTFTLVLRNIIPVMT